MVEIYGKLRGLPFIVIQATPLSMLIEDGKTPSPQITQINLISPLISTSFPIKPTFLPFC